MKRPSAIAGFACWLSAIGLMGAVVVAQNPLPPLGKAPLYNTAKQELLQGKQNDPHYHEMVQKAHDDVLREGKIFGQANAMYATGPYSKDPMFFQNGPSADGWKPARGPNQNAPPPGEESAPPPGEEPH